jgi:hypothetical protein
MNGIANLERASDRLAGLNASQVPAQSPVRNQYPLAMQGIRNVGGGFDINAARLEALSNVGGGSKGSLAGTAPYLAPSNVVSSAAIPSARSNRFNIPSQNLTYGGG